MTATCFKSRLWWLVVLTVIAIVSANRRRPSLRLFPFVQALQRNNNSNDTGTKQQEEESSSTDGYQAELVDDDYDEYDNEEEEHDNNLHVHSLLQVPCCLEVPDLHRCKTVTTIVDTGAQVTVLSAEAAQKCGVVHLMDQRYAGEATGVGTCRVLGRIPAGALLLHLAGTTVPSPAITVLDNNSMGMDLLLGLDFLRDTGAILNMKNEEMILSQGNEKEQVVIPFLQPRNHLGETSVGGWINNDILSSLESSVRHADEYDDIDEEEDDGEDDDEDLDMSGV